MFVHFQGLTSNNVPVTVRQTSGEFQRSEFGAYMRASLA